MMQSWLQVNSVTRASAIRGKCSFGAKSLNGADRLAGMRLWIERYVTSGALLEVLFVTIFTQVSRPAAARDCAS